MHFVNVSKSCGANNSLCLLLTCTYKIDRNEKKKDDDENILHAPNVLKQEDSHVCNQMSSAWFWISCKTLMGAC